MAKKTQLRNNSAIAVRAIFMSSILVNPRVPAYLRLLAVVSLDCDPETLTANYAPGELRHKLHIEGGDSGMLRVLSMASGKGFISEDSTATKVILNPDEFTVWPALDDEVGDAA